MFKIDALSSSIKASYEVKSFIICAFKSLLNKVLFGIGVKFSKNKLCNI